jgi:hypothetical protein
VQSMDVERQWTTFDDQKFNNPKTGNRSWAGLAAWLGVSLTQGLAQVD